MSGEAGRVWRHHIRQEETEDARRAPLSEIGGMSRRVLVEGVACCQLATALPAAATGAGSGEPAAATLPLPAEPLRLDLDEDRYLIDPSFVLDESAFPTQRERIARVVPGFDRVPREEQVGWLRENGWSPH